MQRPRLNLWHVHVHVHVQNRAEYLWRTASNSEKHLTSIEEMESLPVESLFVSTTLQQAT